MSHIIITDDPSTWRANHGSIMLVEDLHQWMRTGEYLTLREKARFELKKFINDFISACVHDPIQHAEAVAGGLFQWKAAMQKDVGAAFKNNRAGVDDMAISSFNFLTDLWVKRVYSIQWQMEYGQWHPSASAFLDAVSPVPALTEEEIEAAWVTELGHSESMMRKLYPGESARIRRGADVMMGV